MHLTDQQKALCRLTAADPDALTVDEKAFVRYCVDKYDELTRMEYRRLKHILHLAWPIINDSLDLKAE